ncbi:MAG: hypothetical protein RL516_316 [Bacteroidota bacterium]|jgi:hypothetical protein
MRKTIYLLTFSLLIFISKANCQELRKVNQEAFVPGEQLKFRVHYGFMDAGEATLTVSPTLKTVFGKSCYQVIGEGKSVGAFDWFFKVRDRYESYIDKDAMLPWYFVRDVREGGYKVNQKVKFDHVNGLATSEKKAVKTPKHVQDLLSAFYFARTIDFSRAAPGDTFVIQTYLDDAIFPMMLKYTGKVILSTDKGKIRCMKFKPYVMEGRVFKEQESMTIWISDDKNRLPVRAEANLMVGSIKMDLLQYTGVAHPLALVK